MHTVIQKALHTIRQHTLLCPGDTVFVALSGGADSVALLHVLLTLRDHLRLASVRALHLHHGLRGESADCDEAFVKKLCSDLGVPLTISHVDTASQAKEHHESIEEAARRLRYTFFKNEIKGIDAAKIATAHNADDQVETILLHMFRGCGLRGLSGIPAKRETIIRPLIDCTADEIRAFCKDHHYDYVTDETNFSLRYSRNRVRHELIPRIQMINDEAKQNILRLSSIAKEEDHYLQNQALAALFEAQNSDGSYAIKVLKDTPTVVLKRALILAAKRCGCFHTEYHHISALIDCVCKKGAVNLPGGIIAVSNGQTLRFKAVCTHESRFVTESVALLLNTPVDFGDCRYEAEVISRDQYQQMLKIHKNLLYFCVSYDIINIDLFLRARQNGDAIRPHKRGCRKSLKKYFNEQKIAPEIRDCIPLLCDQHGIAAILGYCIDERAAITAGTKQILHIKKIDSKGL